MSNVPELPLGLGLTECCDAPQDCHNVTVEGARALVTLCEDGSAPELKELRLDHMDIRDQVSVGRRERREREETQTELWSLPTAYSSDRTSHVENGCLFLYL